jgi:hypothetical protein
MSPKALIDIVKLFSFCRPQESRALFDGIASGRFRSFECFEVEVPY